MSREKGSGNAIRPYGNTFAQAWAQGPESPAGRSGDRKMTGKTPAPGSVRARPGMERSGRHRGPG
ncbi:hypothetical protein [Streptomyces cupreus]|uniref:Uncharacterized protein n=1 Tax=Streptomyces cupreus TaxID=2759956 RepID=A0A7X1J5C8_9ACTN|nr:hypothetical protein [Streptomyces cupreus]MBC2903979.1 hypothetical protein [Streptomyces cupreus]